MDSPDQQLLLKYKISRTVKNTTQTILKTNMPLISVALDSSNELVYLEFVTPTEAEARRIIANVQKWTNKRTTIQTNLFVQLPSGSDKQLTREPETRYKVARHKYNYVIAHDGLTALQQTYIIGGTENEPSPYFYNAISKIAVPTLSSWSERMWQPAIKNKLITLLNCHNITVWRVNNSEQLWQDLVVTLARKGKF